MIAPLIPDYITNFEEFLEWYEERHSPYLQLNSSGAMDSIVGLREQFEVGKTFSPRYVSVMAMVRTIPTEGESTTTIQILNLLFKPSGELITPERYSFDSSSHRAIVLGDGQIEYRFSRTAPQMQTENGIHFTNVIPAALWDKIKEQILCRQELVSNGESTKTPDYKIERLVEKAALFTLEY